MSKRFLLAFIGFIVIFGAGAMWLVYNIVIRKRFKKNLLSLPKERRFFWYKLRNSGFEVIESSVIQDHFCMIDGIEKKYPLKIDFLAKKNNKKYACLFSNVFDEKELLKLFFVYQVVFNVRGVIFYNIDSRVFSIWE